MYSLKASLLYFSGILEINSGLLRGNDFSLFLCCQIKFMNRFKGALDEIKKQNKKSTKQIVLLFVFYFYVSVYREVRCNERQIIANQVSLSTFTNSKSSMGV